MGGRGRGRGRAALSFNVEALGIGVGEALPGPQLQPPPSYPILEGAPAPLKSSECFSRRLLYKTDFLRAVDRLKVEYVRQKTGEKRSHSGTVKVNPAPFLDYQWERFPAELRPFSGKRAAPPVKSAVDLTNVDQLLAELERAETSGALVKVEREELEEARKTDREGDEDLPEGEDIFDESDQEMDDGTDYNQNYFDNGDSYLDEEEDPEDGPIY